MANLKNFFNAVSQNNRIFTAEDIGAMSSNEFGANEKAINYQMNNLGIPFNGDLEGSGDVVFVRGYTRADGTEVKAHYRSKSGHVGGGQNDFAPKNTNNNWNDGINGGINGSPSIILEERNGHYDPETGKKVYYDGMLYFGNDNIVDDITGSITGAAADIVNDVSQEPLQGGVEYNDYSNIYEQLLKGTLPELRNSATNILDQTKSQESINNSLKGWLSQKVLDTGINAVHSAYPNAAHMWNISSQGIDRNIDYINQNGNIFNNISDLPKEYQDYARNKVGTQFGLNDCKGIVFHENSEISKALEHSNTINKYINDNLEKLKQGQVIKNDSLSFHNIKEFDLYNAIGKCDVLETKMNNGTIEMTIGDTYDFNKGSKYLPVQMGRSAQDAKLLEPYYSIIKIKIKL